MNLLAAWKKLLLFGLFGAVGCLAGWAIGEGYLAIARAATVGSGAGQGPSLISKPVPPSAEPPPLPTEFRERLDKAGAHTGDIQISLIWFNTNDLDLHCVDPKGYEIYWQNRRSPTTGGELDVDRNAGCRNPTVEPVENIYWPKDGAPMGHYKVYLDYFQRCAGAPDETRYKINVLQGGERKEFTGTIVKDDTKSEKRLIYEFELTPKVEVVVPPEFQLNRGTTIRIPVAVRRSFYSGKLDLKAEGLPEGVTAAAASIETGKNEGAIELKASDVATAGKKVPIKIVASAPEVSASADLQMEVIEAAFSWIEAVIMGIWTALLAVGLCLALLMGQNKYLGRPLFARGRIPLIVLIAGVVLAGFASGSVGQSLFLVLLSIGVGSLGFLIGWILLGGLLGLGISYFVPNLDRKKAMIAGLVGGLLAAIGFLFWSRNAEWLGRFAGAALLGFCIGLMVAIVEAAFRRVWLEVRYGERETITVNLGPEPVKIGGDARACTVWARGAVDVALRYYIRDGRVICEDAPTRRELIVGNGDTRTVGTVTLTVHTGMGSTPIPRIHPRPSVPAPLPPAVPSALSDGSEWATPAALPELRSPPVASAPVPVVPVSPKPDPRPIPITRPPALAPAVPAPRPPASTKPPVPVSAVPPKPPVPTTGSTPPKPPIPGVAATKAPAPTTSSPPTPPKPPVPSTRPPVPGGPGAVAKSTVPGTSAGAKPPPPTATPKPPAPVAAPKPPMPPPATPSTPAGGGTKKGDPNACPTCGRITPGRPGARFCMMCEKTY